VDSVHSATIPWRTATLLVGAVAAVELVLLVVAGVALLGNSLPHDGSSAAAAKRRTEHVTPVPASKPKRHKHAAKAKPLIARANTQVLVLNGNGLTGAAGTEAAVVRGRGYPVSAVGNAKRTDHGPSIVMYRPGFREEARRLAHDVAIKIVAPLDGLKPSDLGRAKLAVVVGRD
jgi:hypothetical protein